MNRYIGYKLYGHLFFAKIYKIPYQMKIMLMVHPTNSYIIISFVTEL